MSQGTSRADLTLVIALALIVRLAFCFVIYPSISDRFGPGDGYDVIAQNLVHGKGYAFDAGSAAAERLPLYPAFLVASFRVFGDASWPWQLAQCLCGAVTCALVLAAAQRYASRAGALGAALFCVVHPTLILYSARPLTETLYVLLVLLFVRGLAGPGWRARSVGSLWGLQLLTKSTAVLHILAFIPALLRGRYGAVARTSALAVALLLPWGVWNLWTFGQAHLLSARGGITFYHGVYISQHVGWLTPTGDLNREAELALWREWQRRGMPLQTDIVQRDQLAGTIAREWIAGHPREAIGLWSRNLILTWYLGRTRLSMLAHFVLHAALWIAAVIGAVRLWRRNPPARDLVSMILLLAAGYTGFHAMLHPGVRYILPVVPLLGLLAAGVPPRADVASRQSSASGFLDSAAG